MIEASAAWHLAEALGSCGLIVHTMASVYGEEAGQRIADERWLRDTGAKHWIVLMEDDAIRRRPAVRLDSPATNDDNGPSTGGPTCLDDDTSHKQGDPLNEMDFGGCVDGNSRVQAQDTIHWETLGLVNYSGVTTTEVF